MSCECEIDEDHDSVFCEGGCARWFHAWCMGYHSCDDRNIPDHFHCFDCRVHADPTWGLISRDHYSNMIIRFKDLALFRRAIKIAQIMKSLNAANFVKRMGCTSDLGTNLLRRLQEEGFISSPTTPADGATTCIKGGQKNKISQRTRAEGRGNAQKTIYSFNRSAVQKQAYLDYFTPTESMESRLLGLAGMTKVCPSFYYSICAHVYGSPTLCFR
jgi:meiosis-specific protein HOP1